MLIEFDFDIIHRPGKSHINSEFMSRIPIVSVLTSKTKEWRNNQTKDPELNRIRKNIEGKIEI